MKILYFLLSLLIISNVSAQGDISPFATTGFGGVSYFKPKLTKKGMEYNGDPIGVYLNVNGLFFSHYTGQVRKINSPIESANVNYNFTTLGYQMGKDFKVGSESFLSASIKPYVAIGAVTGAFPKIRASEDIYSFGMFISPGVDVRISHLNVGVQYQTMGLIHGSFLFEKEDNFGRGALHGLAFNIGISNSFDLLTPAAYTFRGLDVDIEVNQREYIEYNNRYGHWYRDRVTETTTTVTKTPGIRSLTLVTPFFGVGPTYTMNHAHDRSAPTQMKGISGGFRFSYFMLDGYYETGEYGFKDPASWREIVTTYPVETNFDFSYRLPVTNYGAKIGFNLSKFFALNYRFEVSSGAGTAFWYVPFSRIHIFANIGKSTFQNAPIYTYPAAAERIDNYYLVRHADQKFHPDQVPETMTYLGYGINIEVGAVYVQWNKINYKGFPALTNATYTVGANIPIGRIGTSLIAHRKYKKAWNRNKK